MTNNSGVFAGKARKSLSTYFCATPNPPIGQALACDAFQGHVGTVDVIEAQSRAAVVAEIKLIAVMEQGVTKHGVSLDILVFPLNRQTPIEFAR